MSCACLLPSRARGALGSLVLGVFGRVFGLGRSLIFRIGLCVLCLITRIHSECGECSLGCNERHPAALFVVAPNGVIAALGAYFLDQVFLEQALEDIAGGIAFELGCDWEYAEVRTLAGGGQNDELRIGQA